MTFDINSTWMMIHMALGDGRHAEFSSLQRMWLNGLEPLKLKVAGLRCSMQWSCAAGANRLGVCSALVQQHISCIKVALMCSRVQRGAIRCVARVRHWCTCLGLISAALKQQLHDLRMASEGRHVQWRVP